MNKMELFKKYIRVIQLRRWHISQLESDNDVLYYGQLPIIEYIIANPNCSQTDIANNFAISKPCVNKSIRRMAKNGTVIKEITGKNKNRLNATEKGIQVANNMRRSFNTIDELTLKGLSQQEIEMLGKIIEKMDDNLETDYTRNVQPLILAKNKENK